jgi:hypothetical protein
MNMALLPLLHLLIGWLAFGPELTASAEFDSYEDCSVLSVERPSTCQPVPESFLDPSAKPLITRSEAPSIQILDDAYQAMIVLQEEYFDADYGAWPSAIEWTSAVIGTIISGMLTTLTKSYDSLKQQNQTTWAGLENIVSSTYAQVVGSYYGQDILSLRAQVSWCHVAYCHEEV